MASVLLSAHFYTYKLKASRNVTKMSFTAERVSRLCVSFVIHLHRFTHDKVTKVLLATLPQYVNQLLANPLVGGTFLLGKTT